MDAVKSFLGILRHDSLTRYAKFATANARKRNPIFADHFEKTKVKPQKWGLDGSLARLEGMQLALDGNFADALLAFDHAVPLCPNDATLLAWRGIVFWARARNALASSDFCKALEIEPELRLARLGFAICLHFTDSQGALRIINKLLEENSHDEHALLCKAITKSRKIDIQGSLEVLRTLLALNPNNQAALGAFAIELLDQVSILPTARNDIIWAIQRALQLNPQNPMARRAYCELEKIPFKMQKSTPFCDIVAGVLYLPLSWRDPQLVAE